MDKITIKDLRRAIDYVGKSDQVSVQNVSDEELLNYDLVRNLNMGNIRVVGIVIELERIYGFSVPWELFRAMPDNKVKSLMDVINRYFESKGA